MITVYTCYYRDKLRLPALKSFQPIINLVFEFNNTIESSLRILYFTPNFTDVLLSVQCNGGLLPDIVLLTLCDSIGEPF